MTTSSDPNDPDSLMPWDNPFYTRVREGVKGLLLVGCNSVNYVNDRIQYNYYFPNAVVIGCGSRESNSISKIVKAFQKYGKSFFDDPTSVDPKDLTLMLAKSGPTGTGFDYLCVMAENQLYCPLGTTDVKVFAGTEPLPTDA
jgi:hypothetical protein